MISHLYPTSTPALNLNPKSSRVADPRLACVRNSIGTYVDPVSGLIKTAAANEARVGKDGLVVEESRTNLITNSQVFQTGYYLGNITTADNVAVAPDGTTTAASMLETAVNDFHVIGLTGTSQSNLSQSFFVKPNGRDNICVRFVNSSGDWRTITFNLTGNGSITQDFPSSLSTWTINSKSITPLSNGWYRISVGATTSSTTPNIFSVMCCDSPTPTLVTAWGFPRYTGDVTKGYYVWGAQVEANSFPTSYIPTSGSTVQRLADAITLTNSGIFNPNENTIINEDFGVAGGSDTLTVVGNGEVAKRTAVYNGHLTQEQTNTLAGKDDEWWEWRVVGSPFGWSGRLTNGSIDVDWGDGSPIENLPVSSSHNFIDGSGYHTVRLRLNTSPYIGFNSNSTDFKEQVVSIGPIPASMTVMARDIFNGYENLETVDFTGASFMSTSDYGNQGFQNMFRDCSSLLSIPDIKKDSSVTNLTRAFNGCSSLTRLPFFDTSNVTTFNSFAQNCVNIKEVPFYDTSSANNMANAFWSCVNLTSFPLLDTSNVNNFSNTWYNCVNLASFPEIDTSSGTNFYRAWVICSSLASFPELDFSSGTTFREAWYQCSALTDFPAGRFNTTGTLASNAFQNAWRNCALTAQSIENILVSLDTNGATGIQLGIQGGSNAAKSTWTTAANTAYANLITKSWSITFNP